MNYGVSGYSSNGTANSYSLGSYAPSAAGYGLRGLSGGNPSYAVGSAYLSKDTSAFYNNLNAQLATPAGPHESIVDNYLEDNRPVTPIVNDLGDVQQVVDEAFLKVTGQQFPRDMIHISILPVEDFVRTQPMKNSHNGTIVGYSINRYGKGASTIVIKQDHLDAVLLTIGHEIGHVMSPTLPDARDEEAKAHAFSIAWMEVIRLNNIAGLSPNIRLNPARNGLHDVALDFVNFLRWRGSSSLDVFKTLAAGLQTMAGGFSW